MSTQTSTSTISSTSSITTTSISAQKQKLKKYVLTGSVCVGKTTIIEALSKLGYATFPEFSRALINEELKKEKGILPWNNPAVFQDMYAKKQVAEECDIEKYVVQSIATQDRANNSSKNDCIFMDRCIMDAIAFSQFPQVPVPREVDEHVQRLRACGQDYDLIFLLEPLQQYENDPGRLLKHHESLTIQGLIEKSYKEYGYSLIPVPFMSAEERVKFILSKIESAQE